MSKLHATVCAIAWCFMAGASYAQVPPSATPPAAPASNPASAASQAASQPGQPASAGASPAKSSSAGQQTVVPMSDGMTLAEYAEALNRKARGEVLPPTAAQAPKIEAPVRQRSAPINPLAGWNYVGMAQRPDGSAIFGEVISPTGERYTLYKGDRLMPGYTVQEISARGLTVSCPPAQNQEHARTIKRGAPQAESTMCTQTLRRG